MVYKGVRKNRFMDFLFAYITLSSEEEARRIGTVLVEERLAACVNILSQMESHYWWDGKLETSHEVVLIAKTTSPLKEALQRRVLSLHSYSCPCVVFLPISGGNPDYLEWIARETRKPG
jgi:periplasmic divalent cation tolerance protein